MRCPNFKGSCWSTVMERLFETPGVVVHRRPTRDEIFSFTRGLKPLLLAEDMDDTWTRTRLWFSQFIVPALTRAAERLGMRAQELFSRYAAVANASTLHEYAFIFEEMFAHRSVRPDARLLKEVMQAYWSEFERHHDSISTYHGMVEAHRRLRERFPNAVFCLLTDAPREVARARIARFAPNLFQGLVSVESAVPDMVNHPYAECLALSCQRTRRMASQLDGLLLDVTVPACHAKPSAVGLGMIVQTFGFAGESIFLDDKETKGGEACENLRALYGSDVNFFRALYGQRGYLDECYQAQGRAIHSLMPKPAMPNSIRIDADLDDPASLVEHVTTVFQRTMTER